MKIIATYIFPLLVFLLVTGCQTKPGVTATGTQDQQTLGPERVDIRGYITDRVYHEGQVTVLVEGVGDPTSRFDRALVLVSPITQISTGAGKPFGLYELQIGQQVAIQFRGRYRQYATGAQAVARQLWVEPAFQ